jgi:hypothetical protein
MQIWRFVSCIEVRDPDRNSLCIVSYANAYAVNVVVANEARLCGVPFLNHGYLENNMLLSNCC